MENPTSNLHLTAPRAPRTLNTSALAYPLLAELFSPANSATLSWKLYPHNDLGARITDPSSRPIEYRFTQKNIHAVSPSLEFMLLDEVKDKVIQKEDGWAQLHAVQTVWQHCREPGLLVEASDLYEIYLTQITSVTDIDFHNNVLTGDIFGYSLVLSSYGEHRSHSKNVLNESREEKECQIIGASQFDSKYKELNFSLLAIENLYPGFTERVQLAISLGLNPEEIAQHAVNGEVFTNSVSADNLESINLSN